MEGEAEQSQDDQGDDLGSLDVDLGSFRSE